MPNINCLTSPSEGDVCSEYLNIVIAGRGHCMGVGGALMSISGYLH